VHGDQIAGADELVQLHVVDVAAGAELGGVQDDQEVVAGGPDLGHGVALDTGLDRQGWKPKTSLSTWAAASSPTGMSTRPARGRGPAAAPAPPTGCCWVPSSDTKRTSIPPATSWEQCSRRRSGADADRAGSAAGQSTQRIVVGPAESGQRAGGMTKQSKRARPQTWPFGARGGIRTLDLPITRRSAFVQRVLASAVLAAHVGGPVHAVWL
jgi:hypothetical protein